MIGLMPIQVNREVVDEAMIRAEAASLRPRLREAMPDEPPAAIEARVREWSRENVIERVLLRQAAAADQSPLDPEAVERALRDAQSAGAASRGLGGGLNLRTEIEFQLRVDRLVERHAGRIAQPRNKDVVEYFRKHRDQFVVPELVHAAHIIKNVNAESPEAEALAAIKAIEEELRAGAVFEEVADRASDCPGQGGDLGWFPRGQMVVEFDAVVFSLAEASISGVFRTPFGFHIAKVYGRTPDRPAELDEARPQIEQRLMAEKNQRALERYLDHLRAHAEIAEVPLEGGL